MSIATLAKAVLWIRRTTFALCAAVVLIWVIGFSTVWQFSLPGLILAVVSLAVIMFLRSGLLMLGSLVINRSILRDPRAALGPLSSDERKLVLHEVEHCLSIHQMLLMGRNVTGDQFIGLLKAAARGDDSVLADPVPPPLPGAVGSPSSRAVSESRRWTASIGSQLSVAYMAKGLQITRIFCLIVMPPLFLYSLIGWATEVHTLWDAAFMVLVHCIMLAVLVFARASTLATHIWAMTRTVLKDPAVVLGALSPADRARLLRELGRYSRSHRLAVVGRVTEVDRLISLIEATPSWETAGAAASPPA